MGDLRFCMPLFDCLILKIREDFVAESSFLFWKPSRIGGAFCRRYLPVITASNSKCVEGALQAIHSSTLFKIRSHITQQQWSTQSAAGLNSVRGFSTAIYLCRWHPRHLDHTEKRSAINLANKLWRLKIHILHEFAPTSRMEITKMTESEERRREVLGRHAGIANALFLWNKSAYAK